MQSIPNIERGITWRKFFQNMKSWWQSMKNTKNLYENITQLMYIISANVCPVRSLPGRSQDDSLWRHCRREYETLAHVLGACPYGEVLRNHRHHTIRHMIATSMRDDGYTVYEEVSGLTADGSNRRIDIITFRPSNKQGFILDPTVRFESHNGQLEEVDTEKKISMNQLCPIRS